METFFLKVHAAPLCSGKLPLSLLSLPHTVSYGHYEKASPGDSVFLQHIFPAPVLVLGGPSQCLVQDFHVYDQAFGLRLDLGFWILTLLGSYLWSPPRFYFEGSDSPSPSPHPDSAPRILVQVGWPGVGYSRCEIGQLLSTSEGSFQITLGFGWFVKPQLVQLLIWVILGRLCFLIQNMTFSFSIFLSLLHFFFSQQQLHQVLAAGLGHCCFKLKFYICKDYA